MGQVEELAAALKLAKDEQKEFKKKHKKIFDENRSHSKTVSAAEAALAAVMVAEGLDHHEYDGMEFNIKSNTKEKHNTDLMHEYFDGSDQLKKYLEEVKDTKVKVNTRKAKRARNSDE